MSGVVEKRFSERASCAGHGTVSSDLDETVDMMDLDLSVRRLEEDDMRLRNKAVAVAGSDLNNMVVH